MAAPMGNHNHLKHGLAGTKIYKAWQNMKRRCDSPVYIEYHRYGGRGITYDPKWKTFQGFYDDMGAGYELGLSLERIDIDKNYSLENCKWIPRSEQKNNTSKSRWITAMGVTKTLRDWARETKINRTTISRRLDKGWSPSRALGLEE